MSSGSKKPAWLAVFNRGDSGARDALFPEELTTHFADTLLRTIPPGRQGLEYFLSFLRTAFPDLAFTIQSRAGQEKTHTYTWAARGTHRGPFMRVHATGRRVAFPGRFMMRYNEKHQVVELWSQTNLMGLVPQLGLGPRAEV